MSNWKQLSIDEAQQHPLYGVKGWLLVILILMALQALSVFITWFSYSRMETMYGGYTPLLAILNIVLGLIYAGIAYFGFIKDHRFPNYVITMLWVSFGIGVLNTFIVMVTGPSYLPTSFLIGSALVSIGMILLLIWYFKASKRVNVTYFHREPVNG